MGEDDMTFQEALERGDWGAMRVFPKVDLHNHAVCGTRRENIEKWVNRCISPPPERFDSLDDMTHYVRTFIVPHCASPDGIEFVFRSAIRDAVDDGVAVLEMSVETLVVRLYPGAPDGMLSFLRRLRTEFSDAIDFRPELGISRDHPLEDVRPVVEACLDSGVFGSMDLFGNEEAKPPELYREFYRIAQKNGMTLKAHVGEFGSPELIRRTVEILELDEVQHGISAAESPDVMKFLRDKGIWLNICPTSNLALRRVPSMGAHPARVLRDNGINLTINTDDLLVFGQSVSQEYLNLFKAGVLTAGELDDIRVQSLRHAGERKMSDGLDPFPRVARGG